MLRKILYFPSQKYTFAQEKICQRKKCVKESNIRYVKIIICTVYLLNIESQVIGGNSGQVYNAGPNYKSYATQLNRNKNLCNITYPVAKLFIRSHVI